MLKNAPIASADPKSDSKPALDDHPLAKILGVFQDEPLLDELMEDIHAAQQKRQQEESAAELKCVSS